MLPRHSQWFRPRGSLARPGWESVVDDATPGWQHSGLRIADLAPDASIDLCDDGNERVIIPLAGSFALDWVEKGTRSSAALLGRASVFEGPTDVMYLSCEASARITGHGRVAVATSPTRAQRPSTYLPASDVEIELRGSGSSSRQVHNIALPQVLNTARLIVCEVITPAGNWSSYPPHKHDEDRPGHETQLEEIYYFETTRIRGSAGDSGTAFGAFSAYSSPAGEIEIHTLVHTGDIALVPYGYHGPAMAAPGYDLYYLNVMAGPGLEPSWLASDDPAHAWIRDTWASATPDPRLPITSSARQ